MPDQGISSREVKEKANARGIGFDDGYYHTPEWAPPSVQTQEECLCFYGCSLARRNLEFK